MNDSFVEAMSRVALSLISEIKNAKDNETKRGLNSLLLTLCRNMEDVAPRNASKKAAERASMLGLGDLRQYHWDDGSRFPGGRKATQLHWEHWRPAADLKRDILSLKSASEEQIRTILGSARICWITLDENKKLDDLGHRYNRSNPEKSYVEAQIELAYDWRKHE